MKWEKEKVWGGIFFSLKKTDMEGIIILGLRFFDVEFHNFDLTVVKNSNKEIKKLQDVILPPPPPSPHESIYWGNILKKYHGSHRLSHEKICKGKF